MRCCGYRAKAKSAFIHVINEDRSRYAFWLSCGRPSWFDFRQSCKDYFYHVPDEDTVEKTYKDAYLYHLQSRV